jgi:hypothetical protein
MSSRDPDTSAWARRGRRGEAERLAQAESARIDADTARREAELGLLGAEEARKSAEAKRVAAETTALQVAAERDKALAKAAELEAALAAARGQQEEQLAAEAAVEAAPAVPEPDVSEAPAEPEPESASAPEPAQEPAPAAPESIRFAPRGHQPVLTIVLALASLGAAAAAVYLAYRDELTSGPGLLAAGATVVLAAMVGRMGRGATTVSIERGVVHVATARSTEQADLTSPATLVELIGQPGKHRKVILVRKSGGPLTIDDSVVDLDAFVEALRHWRPNL